MRVFHYKKNIHFRPTINLDKLWTLVPKNVQDEAKTKKEALCIDVTKFGYHKVLGKGLLPKVPLVVKAKFFSNEAEKRIKSIGGACVLTA
jgi:large subunit ribosomal protein L27Ae